MEKGDDPIAAALNYSKNPFRRLLDFCLNGTYYADQDKAKTAFAVEFLKGLYDALNTDAFSKRFHVQDAHNNEYSFALIKDSEGIKLENYRLNSSVDPIFKCPPDTLADMKEKINQIFVDAKTIIQNEFRDEKRAVKSSHGQVVSALINDKDFWLKSVHLLIIEGGQEAEATISKATQRIFNSHDNYSIQLAKWIICNCTKFTENITQQAQDHLHHILAETFTHENFSFFNAIATRSTEVLSVFSAGSAASESLNAYLSGLCGGKSDVTLTTYPQIVEENQECMTPKQRYLFIVENMDHEAIRLWNSRTNHLPKPHPNPEEQSSS